MTNSSETSLERLVVSIPLSNAEHKTIADSNGNLIIFPSFNEKMNVSQFKLPAKVLNKDGKELCHVSQESAANMSRPKFMDSLISIFTREYHFEAPVGTIPNLCKRDEARGK